MRLTEVKTLPSLKLCWMCRQQPADSLCIDVKQVSGLLKGLTHKKASMIHSWTSFWTTLLSCCVILLEHDIISTMSIGQRKGVFLNIRVYRFKNVTQVVNIGFILLLTRRQAALDDNDISFYVFHRKEKKVRECSYELSLPQGSHVAGCLSINSRSGSDSWASCAAVQYTPRGLLEATNMLIFHQNYRISI